MSVKVRELAAATVPTASSENGKRLDKRFLMAFLHFAVCEPGACVG
jgi:hypothetical protein